MINQRCKCDSTFAEKRYADVDVLFKGPILIQPRCKKAAIDSTKQEPHTQTAALE